MGDSKKAIERGQSVTFRVPSDTPEHLLKRLQKLKESERRNFSSKIAQFVMQGVNESLTKEKETITIPLPKQLTKEQRNWMKHEHSEALIGSIVYQLLSDPVRATTLLASLNSSAYDIDDVLYLQEEAATGPTPQKSYDEDNIPADNAKEPQWSDDDDLDDIKLDSLSTELHAHVKDEEKTDDDSDLLGDFLSSMNK